MFLSGKVWIKQMLMSAFLLPSLVCGTAFFINFIAIYYHASRAIPFGTMVSTHLLHIKIQTFESFMRKGVIQKWQFIFTMFKT